MLPTLKEPEFAEEFLRRLSETIAWCSQHGRVDDPKASLRTFSPTGSDLASQSHQVFTVALDRSRALSENGHPDCTPATSLQGGKLLSYFPNENLADGVAEAESGGFFDADNIPPYDTWVWMAENTQLVLLGGRRKIDVPNNYLIAWVPPLFIPAAKRGLGVHVEACLGWLDEQSDLFAKSVRRLKLGP